MLRFAAVSVVTFAVVSSLTAYAADKEASGKFFVKDANGSITLGEGKLVYTGGTDGKEVKLVKGDEELVGKNVYNKDLEGRKLSVFAFPKEANGKKGALILAGSYLRDDKVAVYYGDIFFKEAPSAPPTEGKQAPQPDPKQQEEVKVDQETAKKALSAPAEAGLKYVGGFGVQAEATAQGDDEQ